MSLRSLAAAANTTTQKLNAASAAAGRMTKSAKKAQDAALQAIIDSGRLSESQLKLIDQISNMSVGFYSGTQQLINFFAAADNLRKAYADDDVASILYWMKTIQEIGGVINTWMGKSGKAFDANTMLSGYMNGLPSWMRKGSGGSAGTTGSATAGERIGHFSQPGSTVHLATGGPNSNTFGAPPSTTNGNLP